MTDETYDEIKSELGDRNGWEVNQAMWYDMRYTGLKRPKKPYRGAPDVHYPLGDEMCDKLRPFYLAQIYGQERIAAFLSGKPQPEDITSLAERYFDYTLKQRSNFERAIFTSVDHMLMYGRGPIKTYWDPTANEIRFSPVRPIYIIVPKWTEELCDADWLVHVIHLSETQYKANKNFKKQEKAFINSIKGRGNPEGNSQQQEDSIKRREGITCGQNEHQIVLWECYTRDGDKINVDTISPILGNAAEDQVREQFGVSYKMNGKAFIPLTDIRYELTDPDYYSPRGVIEILSQNEMELCKLWNHKLQFLDYFGNPMFEQEGGFGNTGNVNPRPGLILPQGLKALQPTSAPIDFKEEMQMQRSLAEQRVQVPDLNNNQHDLAGKHSAQSTATGINAIMAQSGAGNDQRARVFRLQSASLYMQAWSIICQCAPKDELVLDDYSDVPPEAIHDQYRIRPSGSADSYNKEKRVAKALAYYQTLTGNPCIPVGPLTKFLLEEDDSSLVKRLEFQDPMEMQQDQAEKQSVETLLMLNERQPRVHPSDDDKAHISDMTNWVQHKAQSGQLILPDTAGRILKHSGEHAQAIQQKKDKEGMALVKQLQPIADMLAQIAQGGAGMPAGAPQGAPMQGSAPMLGNGDPNALQGQQGAAMGAPAGAVAQGALPGPPGMAQAPTQEFVLRIRSDVGLDPAGIEQIVAGIASVQKPIVVNSPPAQVKIMPAAPQMPPMVHVDVNPTPVNVDSRVAVPGAKHITLQRDNDGKLTGAEVKAS